MIKMAYSTMVLIVMLTIYFINASVWFYLTTDRLELEIWFRTYAVIGVTVLTMGIVLVRGLQMVRDVVGNKPMP
jgi:hypothetical protein